MKLLKNSFVVFISISLAVLLNTSAYAQDIAYIAYADKFWQVYVINSDGSERKQVTFSKFDKTKATWYQDEKHLFVVGSEGAWLKVNIKTGKETPIQAPTSAIAIADAVLSPDGKKIAFSMSSGGAVDRNDIWVINVDGSKLEKKTRQQGLQHEPMWSQDGKYIYFLSGIVGSKKQHHDIFKLDLSSGSLSQLTNASGYHFDISTGRSVIAYANNKKGNYDIYLMDDSGKEIQLTQYDGYDASPSLLNRNTMFFSSNRAGALNIWRLDIKSKNLKQITTNPVGARQPVVKWGKKR